MSKILVLTGHPRRNSFCAALSENYALGATAGGHEVRRLCMADLPLDLAGPDYSEGDKALPDWLREAQAALAWADHWVIVAPMWWGGVPAALKAFLDAVLLPGFAFRYRPKGQGWDKLLKGRSARIILTSDTPPAIFRWLWGWPLIRQFQRQILGFCGVAPVRTTLIGPVRPAGSAKREEWLETAASLGHAGG
jgi:putative NADPH-quinone reductase